MERREYAKLNELDEEMWWFRGAQANLVGEFLRRPPHGGARRLLDAGCGTGGLLAHLARRLPDWSAIGLDIDAGACAAARDKSGRPVCAGSVDRLPFADGSLAALFSADVLCHRGVDEAGALASFHRCLMPGGVLILNLPAYRWLLSAHDAAVDNVRRYGRSEVRRMLEAAGFAAIRTSHWNTILFPLMVVRRTVFRTARATSDVMRYPAPLEWLCRAAMRLENAVLSTGLRLPFGGSLLVSAVKS